MRSPSRTIRRLLAVLIAAALVAAPLVTPDAASPQTRSTRRERGGFCTSPAGSQFDPDAAPYTAVVERITAAGAARSLKPGGASLHRALGRPVDRRRAWPICTRPTSGLAEMSLAYRTHGSALEGDAGVLTSIIAGLDWLNAKRYNTSTVRDTNTWYWALGIPMELNDISVLLFDELGPTRIAAYAAAQSRFLPHVYTTGAYSTGANRAWSVKVVALRAMLTEDDAKAREARDGLPPVTSYVTTGDGFYERGGFIQHSSIPYVGGYGISALELSAEVLYLFRTSPWTVADSVAANLHDAVRTTYAPFLVGGVMMDSVRGREISREYRSDQDAGFATIRAIGLLAASAPAADALGSQVHGEADALER